jgi:4-hydroxybenzoate polyprenyltransferase
MKWLQFILSHSIFISFCAVALCYQTFHLLHIPVNYFVYGLVFFATLSSYNAYWLISKYHFSRDNSLAVFFVRNFSNVFFFIIAAVGLLYCLYFLPEAIPTVLIAVLLTFVYSIPLWPVKKLAFTRKAGFLKTVLLAFTWTYVTVIIPAQQAVFISNLSEGLLFAARFLFMLMLCVIFDSRDINVDKIHSLRSLATDVSRKSLLWIMALVFILYLAAGFLLRYYFNDNAQITAFLITGLLTLFVYRLSLKKQGYFFYYFLVDGLMLFSALATFVASI